ncbi:glycosyltransferase family 4 protein [Roseiflexus castenholzii]|jgi:glycosyltransferase involved in cell wall biosynthesis|uniref:Glycosyl transferase group 1 n=1 Tax=Roseiflexus castenholzii (strain DSM 13941 / HLO8) TaxID=383372 RepID=A7NRH2_ROSCS|nr:glycosyltransferase family 1 protein [Roseiflexus castenholzii]ABU60168.1 glycosyl transferase group 1 [Roseiflexus castenholzii DSM 13941]
MHIGVDISLLRIAQAGVLTYHRSLLDHLVRAGRDCHFTLIDVLPLNPGRSMLWLAALDSPNVRVVRCPGVRRGYLSALPAFRDGVAHPIAARIDRILDPIWSQLAVAEMGLELRGATRFVEVFHASDQLPYAPPGAATVLTIHDLTTRRFPDMHVAENVALHAAKERFARDRADRIIAVSEATRRDIVCELGIPPERISVVYEAADVRFRPRAPDETCSVLARYDIAHGAYVLSVGTLEPRKNYIRLIEAYAVLCARYAADARRLPPLIIAGGYGWKHDAILAAPERAGVAGQVRFIGRIPDDDLPALVAGARLFVYPSLYEGFGLPPLEALASGTPVVVANTSSLPEVVGDAGLYCDPYQVSDIARQIAALLDSEDLALRLRHAGIERAKQFSWERAARETLAVYAQARAERCARRRWQFTGFIPTAMTR